MQQNSAEITLSLIVVACSNI